MAGDYPSLAAGIVTSDPDPAKVYRLVCTLMLRLDAVYLFNNAVLHPKLDEALRREAGVRMIDAEADLGTGVGLNVLALAAARDGFERLIVFDQHARVWPGLVEGLELAFDQLEASRRKPAAVGPRLVARPGDGGASPPLSRRRSGVAPEAALVPVAELPLSGALFNLRVLRETGLFRADFFGELVDAEWSFRAWSRGFSCWIATETVMEVPGPPVGREDDEATTLRRFRNLFVCLRLRHVPWRWKIERAAALPRSAALFAARHRSPARAARLLWGALRDSLGNRVDQ